MCRVAFSCKRGNGQGAGDGGREFETGRKQERRPDRMVKSPFCGADEARARASAGISRHPRYPPPPKAAAPSGGGYRSFKTAAKQETESRSKDLNSVSAVRTRLELATPGVTGRYSKPTELPHQLSVNFPFGNAKVQLKFDSANISKENHKKMSGLGGSDIFNGYGCEAGAPEGRGAGPQREVTGPRSACGPSRVRSS